MNIFILSENPEEAARLSCDKHVVKMILESAQMLSTAHRMLDGKKIGKNWMLKDDREQVLYKAVHTGHPCTVWTMKTVANYGWLYRHFRELCREYTHRYNKVHATETKLLEVLRIPPTNIAEGGLTSFAQAMGSNPECIDYKNPVGAYRAYYQTKQDRFKMSWTNREIPSWFKVIENA